MRAVTSAVAILLIGSCLPSAASFASQENEASTYAILDDLRRNSLSAEEIRGVTKPIDVRVVALESFSGADLEKLDDTLRKTEDGFGEVQAAIASNETLESILGENDVRISDLVAVTRSETGKVTIYIDKPMR